MVPKAVGVTPEHKGVESPVGIYVLANDAVADWLSAFVASFRTYNPTLPFSLIPFNDDSARCEAIVTAAGGEIYCNPTSFAALEQIGGRLEIGHTPAGPYWFRRFAVFNGPFEHFAYLDCRTIVLSDLRPFALAPQHYDVPLVHYDCAINQVYKDGAIRTRFCRQGYGHGFLSGIWAGRRGLFSLADMQEACETLVSARDQMNARNTDQFFLNYLCDAAGLRVCHMADLDSRYAHSAWANDRGSIYQSGDGRWRKWDFGGLEHKREMPFVHWAGIRLHPSMPHYFLHQRFRGRKIGTLARMTESVVRPLGRLGLCLRGNRWLNTLYHTYLRPRARS